MTPEERAAKAYEDWKEGTTVGHPSSSYRIDDLPLVIAAHIRAAENGALERAALACEDKSTRINADDYESQCVAEALDEIAIAVRALKHKETT
jgi:hypothetical protein